MSEADIWEYITIFNEEKNMLTDSYELRSVVLDLHEEKIIQFLNEFVTDLNAREYEKNNQAIAMIMYGFRAGVIELRNELEIMTHQSGYVNTPLWSMGRALDEMLNKELVGNTEEDDEINPAVSISNLIEWIINPEGNIEIRDAILGKMILPMVKEIGKNARTDKCVNYTVVIPPVSTKLSFPEWQEFFGGIKCNHANIRIVDYSEFLNIKENERVYLCLQQSDGSREFLIISAYEIIRGKKVCVGTLAFDICNNEQFEMENVHEIRFDIDKNGKEVFKKEKILQEVKSNWEYIETKCPLLKGFKAFLGSVSPTFMGEMYVRTNKKTQRTGATSLLDVFNGTEALQVAEICSRLLGERNLNQIALGDMVYVADLLSKDNAFKTVLIKQKRNESLGTLSEIGNDFDLSRLAEVPSNYASFTWKVKTKNTSSIVPYFSLDKNKHSIKQIVESTVNHYTHCTTSQVAEDIMYLYNDDEPNAYFTAKVFMILSAINSLVIESKDDIIQEIQNVDKVKYDALDDKEKASIAVQKTPVKKKSLQTTIFRPQIKMDNLLKMNIDQAGFSVRTYNCLRRAKIKTLGEIVNKTPDQLLKIRNLGHIGVNEINNKLKTLGLI